jgi:hypothetical protein
MIEQPEKVFFDPSSPELFFLVGSKLSAIDKEQLLQLLMSNRTFSLGRSTTLWVYPRFGMSFLKFWV